MSCTIFHSSVFGETVGPRGFPQHSCAGLGVKPPEKSLSHHHRLGVRLIHYSCPPSPTKTLGDHQSACHADPVSCPHCSLCLVLPSSPFLLGSGFVSLSSLPAPPPTPHHSDPDPTSHPLSLPHQPVFPEFSPALGPASHFTRLSKPFSRGASDATGKVGS